MSLNSENDYIDIFPDLFFDIENPDNDIIKNRVQLAIDVLSSLIVRLGEIENEFNYLYDETDANEVQFDDSIVQLVIMSFIRKIMEQLDGIIILYSKCSFSQAQIILRALVENVVALEFILQKDTDLRAAAYFLEHHYKEIDSAKEFFSDNPSPLKSTFSKKDFEQYKKLWAAKETALKNLINKHHLFFLVDEKRSNAIANRKRKTYSWYEIGGPANFREMMQNVGLGDYYKGIYGSLSFETHALNASTELQFKEDGSAYINRIRSPHNGSSTFSFACTFAISILNKLYDYLGDGIQEKKEFANFFTDYQKQRDLAISYLETIILE